MDSTIELSLVAAKAMLPVVERELEAANNELLTAQGKVDGYQRLVSELRAKINNTSLPLQNGETLRKRRPKGFAAEAIRKMLVDYPGGLTLQTIQNALGIDHSTIYRTLTDPNRNKGQFVKTEDGAWKNAP
jgi:hypothetical protein